MDTRKTNLLLGRHYGQSIVIGQGDNEVEVIVERELENGHGATLRIIAPKHIDIDRKEIRERKHLGIPIKPKANGFVEGITNRRDLRN